MHRLRHLLCMTGAALLLALSCFCVSLDEDGEIWELWPVGICSPRPSGLAFRSVNFQGKDGYLELDESCRGRFRLWIIDEDDGLPTGAKAGCCYRADGFILDGSLYKIDGSTSVRLRWEDGKVIWESHINALAYALGKGAPHLVLPEQLGPANSHKFPKAGLPAPLVE